MPKRPLQVGLTPGLLTVPGREKGRTPRKLEENFPFTFILTMNRRSWCPPAMVTKAALKDR
jgi:hypothetical protein